jgi:carboxypeptidase Taq
MTQNIETVVGDFRNYMQKIACYQHALGILYWDSRTIIPRRGLEQRALVLGFLSTEVYKLTVAPEMERFLTGLGATTVLTTLDPVIAKSVREYQKEYTRMKKIPPALYEEYVLLTAKAENVWEDAKRTSDFKLFEPYLTKIVDFNRKLADYWGYRRHPYDALLEPYEPGLTVALLDPLFAELRRATIALLKRIQTHGRPVDLSGLTGRFTKQAQEELGRFLLGEIGFDFTAGNLAESVHPFTGGANHPGDVRLTTHYYEDNLLSSLFSCLHEGGHGIYEQNIDPKYVNTPLGTGTSMGVHESQSRFYENIIGRSKSFWQRYFPKLQALFPKQFSQMDSFTFYRAVNRVVPSLIRTEADELTYNLHIILRYEIEKALLEGACQVAELPQIWNEKMREYLGVTPSNDAEGVLQDMHWSGGALGYFPSYTIGNIYSAQFAAAMERTGLDLEQTVAAGDFSRIKQWLRQQIHQYGKSKTPAKLLQDVTGEQIDAEYLIRYLERKYGEVYGI